MIIALSIMSLILIFVFGFYLGNQIGNSAHIRQEIVQARSHNRVTGLHHLRK